mgnify:CR=1 FL=1
MILKSDKHDFDKAGTTACCVFIKDNKIAEHIRADTAGSAEMISKTKDTTKGAIASSLSAQIYGLETTY